MDCLTLARGVKEYCEAQSLDCGEMMELQCYHRSHCVVFQEKKGNLVSQEAKGLEITAGEQYKGVVQLVRLD